LLLKIQRKLPQADFTGIDYTFFMIDNIQINAVVAGNSESDKSYPDIRE
jgi:hypothetical protein